MPQGGKNLVVASPIEVVVRPDDEVNGPNLLVRYLETETLQEIYDGLQGQKDIDVVVLYDTDLTEVAEEASFVRGLYR